MRRSSTRRSAIAPNARSILPPCSRRGSIRTCFRCFEQVQVACNHAERGATRLAGLEPPTHADKEASFEDLKTRIADTIGFVKSVDPKKMEGAENREITYPVGQRKETRTGADYLSNFSLPNFYFHVAAAYNILRHNGVPIGKAGLHGRLMIAGAREGRARHRPSSVATSRPDPDDGAVRLAPTKGGRVGQVA